MSNIKEIEEGIFINLDLVEMIALANDDKGDYIRFTFSNAHDLKWRKKFKYKEEAEERIRQIIKEQNKC